MSTIHDRSRDYAASLGLCLAVLAGELPVPVTGGEADTWIKVTPRGAAATRDGRSYSFDPEKLVARFQADKVDLPADFDHAIALTAIRGVKAPAIGWATELEARPDGTYAHMDWLPEGKAALATRTHRYVSPTFHHDADGKATWLHSISLVTTPALGGMPALATALPPGGEAADNLATLTAAVGLEAGADLGTVLKSAGHALVNSVPKSTHEAVLSALTATTERLNALSTTTRQADVERLVDEAIRERKIVPAQRAGYLAMCAHAAGLDTFRGLMAATMPMLQPSGLDGRAQPGVTHPANAQAIVDAAKILQAERSKLGITLSIHEAINAVAQRASA